MNFRRATMRHSSANAVAELGDFLKLLFSELGGACKLPDERLGLHLKVPLSDAVPICDAEDVVAHITDLKKLHPLRPFAEVELAVRHHALNHAIEVGLQRVL